MIYLDNAATSFPKPAEVITAVTEALKAPASPGRSGHTAALGASRTIHQARKNIARLFGIKDNSRIAFTSNITWAINMALGGFKLKAGDQIISTSMEHNSVARPLARLVMEKGIVWEMVQVDEQGVFNSENFLRLLTPATRLVVINHASNVTGALAPAQQIKEMIGTVPLLLDTAQTAGSRDLSNAGDWADIVAFTGHKGLLGPTGTGGLWVRPGLNIRPLATGGTGSASESLEHPSFLPDALEPGTPNTHGLAGLAAGVEVVLKAGVENIQYHEMGLTESFLKGLQNISGVKIWGPLNLDHRVSTVAITLEGWSSSSVAKILEDKYGILTRAGLQCSPLAHRTQGTFDSGGVVRFSFGFYNTTADVDAALAALGAFAKG